MKVHPLIGLNLAGGSYSDIIKVIDDSISGRNKFTFHNVNSHIILQAHHSQKFKSILQEFSQLYLDGIGIYLGIKFLYAEHNTVKRITGTDLYYKIVEYAITKKRRVFFLGVNGLSSEMIRSKIAAKFPLLTVAGAKSDNGFNQDEMIEIINKETPDILFVGLGTPKQEEFVTRNLQFINCPVQIVVGSGIEYLAGVKIRAPKFMQFVGLEWLYRLLTEPSRLWKRYLIGIPQFMWLIIKQKYRFANHTAER